MAKAWGLRLKDVQATVASGVGLENIAEFLARRLKRALVPKSVAEEPGRLAGVQALLEVMLQRPARRPN